jgi:hypothetical protein
MLSDAAATATARRAAGYQKDAAEKRAFEWCVHACHCAPRGLA